MICMRLLFMCIALIICSNTATAGYKDSMLVEAERNNGDHEKLFKIYNDLGYYSFGIDYAESIEYFKKAINAAEKLEDKDKLGFGYIGLSSAYRFYGDIDRAYEYGHKALKVAQKSDSKLVQYHAYIRLAQVYRRLADYDSALYCYITSATIAEDHLNTKLAAESYAAMGGYYATTGDNEKALKYHLQALALREANKDLGAMANSYDNIGIIYRKQEDYREALKWLNKARGIYEQLYDSSNIAFIYNDIGAVHSKAGALDSGDYYLKKSIAMREHMYEYIELAYTYNYLGENYERMRELDSAETYIKKALALAIEIKNNKQHYEALESLSDFYSRNRMYDSAYAYLRSYNHFRDSMRSMDNEKLISELNTKYETEKKEKKIQEQEFELTRRNYLLGGALFILLFGSLLGYSAYRRYKLKQQAALQQAVLEQQELATKAVLEAEENERQRIATDLHDGVGQMMSAVRINLSNISNSIRFENDDEQKHFENALKLVDDSCAEVRAVSHNIMPNALLRNSLAAAVRSFINKINEDVITINLYSEGLNEHIDENVENMLYRVIQECINNVIKHAKANTLDMSLIKEGHEISITIEDNGVGFDTANSKKFEGVGLKSIKSRVGYLKGTVEWDSRPGEGTVVTINVPLQ